MQAETKETHWLCCPACCPPTCEGCFPHIDAPPNALLDPNAPAGCAACALVPVFVEPNRPPPVPAVLLFAVDPKRPPVPVLVLVFAVEPKSPPPVFVLVVDPKSPPLVFVVAALLVLEPKSPPPAFVFVVDPKRPPPRIAVKSAQAALGRISLSHQLYCQYSCWSAQIIPLRRLCSPPRCSCSIQRALLLQRWCWWLNQTDRHLYLPCW